MSMENDQVQVVSAESQTRFMPTMVHCGAVALVVRPASVTGTARAVVAASAAKRPLIICILMIMRR